MGESAIAVGAPPGPEPGPAVRRSPSLVTRRPRRSRARLGVHPADPRRRIVDLAVLRQRLGAGPQPVQGFGAAGGGDRGHEALALAVLLHLHVHPGEAHDRPLERRLLRLAALVELRADPLDVRHEVPADLVHHVVAEPLEQAHHRLRLPEEPALLVGHQALHPVLGAVVVAADRPAEAPQRLASEPARLASEQPQLALEALGEIRTKPGMGSWSAIHVRKGSRGTSRTFAVWRMFSSTNRSLPGCASAVSSARSYWPRTFEPMTPRRKPSWRVVTQRLARAIVALARPPPGGTTWSSSSVSSWPISWAKVATLAWTQPPRSTTADRSTTPGSSVPSAAHSRGTICSIAAAYDGSVCRSAAGVRVPGVDLSRPIATRSAPGQSTRP